MNCELSSWSTCAPELREAWGDFASCSSLPVSPFLTWEFFDCVDRVRQDVEVVVLRESGEVVGCFPFQRRKRRQGLPAAALLNDLHGPIAVDANNLNFTRVLRTAELSRFDFHSSPIKPRNCNGYSAHAVPAFRAELGFRAGEYVDCLRGERYSVRQQLRKASAMERNIGPLRLEWRTMDEEVFAALQSWKSLQYQAMGIVDLFAIPWTCELLRRLLSLESNSVHGQLSALYAGNVLVAVHYGLRCGDTLHSWFPAYSLEYAKYSPGMELFLQLAARGPSEGVTTLDLGYGAEPFKEKLTNRHYSVQCGSVDLLPWRQKLSAWSRSARQQAKKIPLSKGMKRVIRRASTTLDPIRYL